MKRLLRTLTAAALLLGPWTGSAFGQTTVPSSEVEALRQEIQKLQDRLNRLEQSQRAAPPAVAPVAPAPVMAAPPGPPPGGPPPASLTQTTLAPPPPPGEREIELGRSHPFEIVGLPKPEYGGLRLAGFFVGSFNYNNRIQMVPEFAGGIPVSSEPGRTDARFDAFTIGAYKTFAPWLTAGASLEVERHSTRHAHGFDPAFGCPGTAPCIERFGSEAIETEVSLHRFYVTAVAPVGNGLALSFGRFDTPYGYERHDAPLNVTATTSEVQRFGRPQSMTGFMASYAFAPWLDVSAWIVNRWENETTETPLEDNNAGKSFGTRVGFTPLQGRQLLNFGLGGWVGPEQDNRNGPQRWIVDFDVTWTPIPRLFLAGELVWGGESGVSFRRRGIPYAAPSRNDLDARWFGMYALAHYDVVDWLGVSFRYGLFNDVNGARTGVEQVLQSWTVTPILHLSRLVPDLRPLGVTYARTGHPLDWVDVRFEYRLNTSNKHVFSDAPPGVDVTSADRTAHQFTLQFVVNY
jgi:putative OmpL-like beta-barrel porin-2